ncbi:MAG: RidA family protein [Syntrophomonadaceae bacterium]|nr:RidA family protein [Syntrophomonadaceae bacterium]MDD3023850.1 RidA family protein [Syntrophomonadaceae bacterium]
MNIITRLHDLNITIPDVNPPLAAYQPGILAGEFIYVSGQLPIKEGKLLYCGKLGSNLTIDDGKAACRIAVINCLAVLKNFLNTWDDLDQIIKLTGYINSESNFGEHAAVLNGASELLEQVLSVKGRHARAAVGVNSLPMNAACEVEMIARIKV